MTLRTFHLFYLLTILLLVSGLLTKDIQSISAGWHTTINKGMWSFFVPTSIFTLLTGLIYNLWFKTGRPVRKRTIIIHFILVALGLLFSLNIYQLTRAVLSTNAPDTTAIATDDGTLVYLILGPFLLITSLILFIVALVNTKRTPT